MRVLSHLFVLIILSLMISGNTQAAAIGVNKAVINYEDVLKGGYAEDTFMASTDSEKYVELQYEFLGEIADWMSLETEGDMQIRQNEPETLKVITEPPITVPNGIYKGILRITTGEIAKNEGQFGSTIKSAFRIRITITITGRQIQSCSVGGVSISSAEYDKELELTSTIKNSGNVNLIPEYEIDIWNSDQTKLLKTINLQSTKTIRPTQTATLHQEFSHDLDLGQYFADVTVKGCGKKEVTTFQILDRGEIADKGELVQIYNQPWAKTNDIVPIAGNFRNQGERTVSVKLKGTITLNGNIVKVIDTDLIDVPPGDVTKLETFFNPTEPGQYKIKLRALYNNKLTFERESILNVNPSGNPPKFQEFRLNWYPIILFVLVIIAITLIFLIKKKQSRPRHKRIKY